jgi:hypothetical protein
MGYSKEDISYSGDYVMRDVVLINHNGERVPLVRGLVQQISIYEGINKNSITGTATILDSQNLINTIPLCGNERLAFRIYTPAKTNDPWELVIDASEEEGYPFHIYSLTDLKKAGENMQNYILHFGSVDFINNIRMRVSQAYEGPIHDIAAKILKDPMGLNTPRALIYEPTLNKDKVVIPNLRPLDAINFLANRALSKNSNAAGYYFYETTKAFHFRSYESMLSLKGKYQRKEKLTLTYQPKVVKSARQVEDNMFSVDNYEFSQHYDTAANQAMGTYASRVIMHNIFDKSFTRSPDGDYNYVDNFGNHFHTDSGGHGASMWNLPISTNPVDTNGNNVGKFPESYVCLQPTTRFLHGNNSLYSGATSVTDLLAIAGKSADAKAEMSDENKEILSTLASIGGVGSMFGVIPEVEAQLIATQISQHNQIANSSVLKLTMPGHSYLQAGDVIKFELPAVEKGKGTLRDKRVDEHHSGRYLITSLRHMIQDNQYKMVLECIKDSVYERIPSSNAVPYFKSPPRDKVANIYDEDEFKIMDIQQAE